MARSRAAISSTAAVAPDPARGGALTVYVTAGARRGSPGAGNYLWALDAITLRTVSTWRADPLVVVMGDSAEDAADRMLRSIDPYEFMQKPLEERELAQVLGAVARMREPTRVMLVDDSKAARRLMGKVLEASRFTMELAAVDSGEAALKRLKDELCDVVFLDYAMPGIDGLETACLVQELMPEVRVVMVSASQNPAVEKAARYFGAVHFLRKPFFAREVDKAMHLALDLPLTSFMREEKAESDQLELALFA